LVLRMQALRRGAHGRRTLLRAFRYTGVRGVVEQIGHDERPPPLTPAMESATPFNRLRDPSAGGSQLRSTYRPRLDHFDATRRVGGGGGGGRHFDSRSVWRPVGLFRGATARGGPIGAFHDGDEVSARVEPVREGGAGDATTGDQHSKRRRPLSLVTAPSRQRGCWSRMVTRAGASGRRGASIEGSGS